MSGSTEISGDLTLKTMPEWLAKADTLGAAGRLELSGISRADSSGLALLLELNRRARARGAALEFVGAPSQLRTMATFFGLDAVLKL